MTVLTVIENAPHEYKKAWPELHPEPYRPGHVAKRTGISRPGYVSRAAYEYEGEYYIFDGGRLVPTQEWHDDEDNILPEHRPPQPTQRELL